MCVCVFGCELWVDVFGLFTFCSEGTVQNKKKTNEGEEDRAGNESELKARIEYMGCLHPGALEARNTCSHISDAPRLAFASMSHFK